MTVIEWGLMEWLEFIPFVLIALVLLGWTLIQVFQIPRSDSDLLTISIIMLGPGVALYIGSIGIDRSVGGDPWPSFYYITLRSFLGVAAAVGIIPTYRNVWRAWKQWRTARHAPEQQEAGVRVPEDPLALTRTMADTVPVVVADATGIIRHSTTAFDALVGAEPGELCDQNLTVLMPQRYRSRHLAGLSKFLRTGESTLIGNVVEVDMLRRDGTEVPIYLAITTTDIDGEPWFIGSMWPRNEGSDHDVTRKELDARGDQQDARGKRQDRRGERQDARDRNARHGHTHQ